MRSCLVHVTRSLSLTPLKINSIKNLTADSEQVDVDAQAILFESGLFAVLPDDIPEKLALAALDVAGAPAQVDRLVTEGEIVCIIGGGGKSGILCLALLNSAASLKAAAPAARS